MKTLILVMAVISLALFSSAAWAQDEPGDAPASAAGIQPGGTAAAGADEEESLVSIGAEVDLNSRYVWRGLAFSEGPTMNPSVWLTVGDFTLASWGNMPISDDDDDWGKFNEADVYATYAFEKDAFSGEVTYLHYFYPYAEEEATGEVSVKLAWAFEQFGVYAFQSLDVENFAGAYYAELGLESEQELSDSVSLEEAVLIGYGNDKVNEVYVGPSVNGLNVIGASVALTWYATENFYLRPHLEYYSLLHEDLRRAVDEPDLVNFGIAAGLEL